MWLKNVTRYYKILLNYYSNYGTGRPRPGVGDVGPQCRGDIVDRVDSVGIVYIVDIVVSVDIVGIVDIVCIVDIVQWAVV